MNGDSSGENLSVLIVEDEPAARDRMVQAIELQSDMTLLGAVGTVNEAQQQLAKQWPSVLLVDLGLPDGDGTELIRQVDDDHRACEILVVTVFGDEKHVLRAIECGAGGYLLKEEDSDQIGRSIRHLMNGSAPISPSIARHLLTRFKSTSSKQSQSRGEVEESEEPACSLTGREKEILGLIAKGYSSSEIGEMLEVTYHTVTSHVKNIYRKLSVHSRSEAIFEAVQRGIVDLGGRV